MLIDLLYTMFGLLFGHYFLSVSVLAENSTLLSVAYSVLTKCFRPLFSTMFGFVRKWNFLFCSTFIKSLCDSMQ